MKVRSMTRLSSSLLLFGALILGACGPAATPTPAKPAAPTAPTAAPVAKPAATTAPAAAQPTAAKPAATGLGTAGQPIRMAFVPSSDSQKVLASGKPIADLLEKETGLKFEVSVPNSYAAVIEAMGAKNVEVGWLAPFAYVLAHDKYGAEVILATVRQGSKTYRGQIIVPADSPAKELKDLKGKKFGFADPASASGYLFPNALLAENGIDSKTFFSEATFLGGHDKVVIAVYNKQVDGGATYGDSVEGGPPTDARTRMVQTLPDVMEKVRVLAKTDPIPNDTVSVRKDLPADLVQKIQNGLLAVAKTDDGKKALKDLYTIDGLAAAADKDYEPVRRAARVLKLDLEEQIKPAAPQPKPAASPAAPQATVAPAATKPAATKPAAPAPTAKP